MKRLAALVLLALLSLTCVPPAHAQRMTVDQAERQSRKDAKKQGNRT